VVVLLQTALALVLVLPRLVLPLPLLSRCVPSWLLVPRRATG
jgi:hypothetical protein